MWSVTTIAGKSVDQFEPADADPRFALIYLHGHGGERLVDLPEVTSLFEEHRLRVVAPRGGRSWWLDRISSEFDLRQTPATFLAQELVPWIRDQWRVEPPGIGLLGVSMGGQGVLNFAYRAARKFPCVAAISPAVDFHEVHGQGWPLDELFDSREQARQETATLNIHPLNWPRSQFFCCDPLDATWHPGCERLASKLMSMGIPFESDLSTSLGGHNWVYFTKMMTPALEFLVRSLEQVDQDRQVR